jgi:hypothetical protein
MVIPRGIDQPFVRVANATEDAEPRRLPLQVAGRVRYATGGELPGSGPEKDPSAVGPGSSPAGRRRLSPRQETLGPFNH